jgi:hypothetical protein
MEYSDPNNTNYATVQNLHMAFGNSAVTAVSADVIMVENNGTKALYMKSETRRSYVYIVNRATGRITVGSPIDAQTGSLVVTAWIWAYNTDFIIYK